MRNFQSSSLHYGLRADILKKAIRKCLTLKIDFSANFNLTHEFFGRRLSQHPKNWKAPKLIHTPPFKAVSNSKNVNGSQNFRFYKCYDICFHNFCDKHPLMGKKCFWSLKKIFFKYFTSLFWRCRQPNIWDVTLLSLSPSSSSALSSTGPFFMHLEYLRAEKWWSRLKFPSEIFGCGENEGQSSKFLNVIAPIALIP